MGFNVSIKDIILSGGVTLAALILLSVYSIALIWERWRFYRRSLGSLRPFLAQVRKVLQSGDLADAVTLARAHKGLASAVVAASLVGPSNRDERMRAAERSIAQASAALQRGTGFLGTVGSVAPFIGLFGTVIGVMRAFRDLAGAAGAGPGVVAIGISEALVCTAAGLFVAIPAVAAYNYFHQRTAQFEDEMRWISEEILQSLTERAKK